MRRVVWSGEALANLRSIRDYIVNFNPMAAERLTRQLVDAAESLVEFPERGRSATHGHREFVAIVPYVIRYLLSGEDVVILAIRHGAREPR